MDEILVNNFMVFSELVESEYFDLVIGDEAWDVDHFLHENPELKRFQFGWLTDFVGWLPMPDADERERFLTADLNAEMLEHRARFGAVRDRSIFVGNPDDVVPDDFGPGLPSINELGAAELRLLRLCHRFRPDRAAGPGCSSSPLGLPPGRAAVHRDGRRVRGRRRICCAGCSTRCRLIRHRVPDLRFLVVTGPRIDPASPAADPRATCVGFLPDLYRELAACDIAVVQGGLTTCMELTAAGTPFVYVPLRHHFEQNIHVRRRLEQYSAGRCLQYEQAADPELLAEARDRRAGRRADVPAGGDRRRPAGRRDAGRVAAREIARCGATACQLASPATRLMVAARITATNRNDNKACRSAAARISLLVKSVSETWNVMPMVKAR